MLYSLHCTNLTLFWLILFLKILLIFYAPENEIILLISFSACPFIMCRDRIDFCMLNTFIEHSSFFVWITQHFLYTEVYHLQIQVVLFLPLNLGAFYFISCLVSLSRNSKTMLSRSGKNRYPSLQRKTFNVHN